MPRQKLKAINGVRQTFTATIARRGQRDGWNHAVDTLLLKDLRDANTGELLTDHLWIDDGLWSQLIKDGSAIRFDARVGTYLKGYQGRREDVYNPVRRDWRIQRPTKVHVRDADGRWQPAPKAAKPPAYKPPPPPPPTELPATDRQIKFLRLLGEATGNEIPPNLSKAEASELIEELLPIAVPPQCASGTKRGHRCNNRAPFGEHHCGRHAANPLPVTAG